MDISPERVTKSRESDRKEMHMEMRKVVALELIADTLEAIRLDISGIINSRVPDNKQIRRSGT